ncbi:ABC transporter permease [Cellulomonas fimi]|uniref:ABC transporter permease n=1 Tax=Cellulomonas fimi TaxID=1708 RepID=UPI00234D5160|nr:ABC transporter permease [Cellulomonas fimi]MDC7120934.1 ABC transporter permease [Cellulomonas fimi]
MSRTGPTPHTPWGHVAAVGAALAAVLTVVALAFLWPSVTAEPHDLPVAVAGPPAAAEPFAQGVEAQAPGVFDVVPAADRAAAVELIETREVYGAVVLGAQPEVLTASAASPMVAQQLATLAPTLQAQLAAATGEAVTVGVTDVVPLGAGDPRGIVLGAATFPLVLGGMIGGIGIALTVVGARRRVAAVLGYAALGGLATTAVLQTWWHALGGSFWVTSGVVALTILAIASVVVGFTSLVGRRGLAIGPVLFLLVANPIAAAAMPWQMLPAPWGAIGQWLPPGAGATLLRDTSYFPAADTSALWLTLTAWAVLGLSLALLGHLRDAGAATRAAVAEAEADAASVDGDRAPQVVPA